MINGHNAIAFFSVHPNIWLVFVFISILIEFQYVDSNKKSRMMLKPVRCE